MIIINYIYLDNSNIFNKKDSKKEKFEIIIEESFSKVYIKEKQFLIPKVIVDSDKFLFEEIKQEYLDSKNESAIFVDPTHEFKIEAIKKVLQK